MYPKRKWLWYLTFVSGCIIQRSKSVNQSVNRIFLRLLPVAALCFFLSACVKDEEEKHKGTLKGFSACLKKNEEQSKLVNEKVIKNQCVRRHERYRQYGSGALRANVQIEKEKACLYGLKGTNEHENFIITSMTPNIFYIDDKGEKHVTTAKWSRRFWIEPLDNFSVTICAPFPTPNEFKIEKWCKRIKSGEKKLCKGFYNPGIKGLKINLVK